MHTLNLTNNSALLIRQMLSQPNIFTTPGEIIRAGHLIEKIELTPPTDKAELSGWLALPYNADGGLGVTEAQRELLKLAATKLASQLPPGKETTSILEQLGFEA